MLGFSGLAQFMSAPGQSYSVAAIKDPMRAGLGLSETDYSLAYGFATVVSACLLPVFGRLCDRFGARVLIPAIATGLGAACMLMSTTQSLTGLYIGFTFVRSLGQGALSLVAAWLVGEWFLRRRGMATAIAGIGGGLSVMTVPLINDWCIRSYSWQTAWMMLAVAVWATLIVPTWLFVRDRPEDLGLHPDGVEPAEFPADATAQHNECREVTPTTESWTVSEVVRNPTFWKLLCVPATSGLVGTGLIFHAVELLGSHGLSSTTALGMISLQAVFSTALTFPAGWATDRWASRYLLLIAMTSLAISIVLLQTMPAAWLVVVYALLLGVHSSIMRSTANVVWINYYGRENQGAVRGVAWSAMILSAAIGPLPLAVSIDHFGSYAPALWLFLALPIGAAIVVSPARPPQRGSRPTS
jgi:sugar phosphate permease